MDRPTLHNQGASLGSDLTATKSSSCRSPCIEVKPAIYREGCKDKRLEGRTERMCLPDIQVPTAREHECEEVGMNTKVPRGLEHGMGMNVVGEKVMPSGGNNDELVQMRKPESTLGTDVSLVDKTDDQLECSYKRGGFCNTHGSMGVKYVQKSKVWSKWKNGNCGYVYKSNTKYVCRPTGVAKSIEGNQTKVGQYEGVAKSNRKSLSEGCGQTTETSFEALGGTTTHFDGGTTPERISGVDIQAGSAKSESLEGGTK